MAHPDSGTLLLCTTAMYLSIISHAKYQLLAGAFGYHANRVHPIRPVIIPNMSSQPHCSDDQHNDGGEDYLFSRAIL